MKTAEHDRALAIAERWLRSPPGDFDCDECVVGRQLIRATERSDNIKKALEESIKLQSHYANLLNTYDGGTRMQFSNADAWVLRLLSLEH